MARQTEANGTCRAILVDWLVDVHLKFRLLGETLYLAVNLIDRYLEIDVVKRSKLQLVGCAALFIASKYEEVLAPEARDFVFVSDRAFTRKALLQTEGKILSTLNFNLTSPSALLFLQRFASVAGLPASGVNMPYQQPNRTVMLARYLIELSLPSCRLHKHTPSRIAAAALFLALRAMGSFPWPACLETHTKYTASDLAPCILDLHELHLAAPHDSLQAVRRKYAQDRFGAVSGIPLE